ncbi:type I phosphomannose isomerase catalytic subunit [Formosa maritima]|uniref:Phosphohexomutase n=1 Tax=Formosa maritima TaxID=2592046 RepID=A0A5D0G8V6_9FLAO|nr:type I phosphomannose isomerase catalytic subunit [Formosa maritima]TYA54759.1 mannose-6-phosphate isomerase [Formosa maritima]
MTNSLYPLKFKPILKEKIWGGQKLNTLLNKNSQSPNIGESWEISDVEGNTSIVANGKLIGLSLKQLLEIYKAELIGTKNYKKFGHTFPLLIKFIDAKADLSIQLHPNDEIASRRHNSFGKTEMWYVMQTNPNSNLIIGFNQEMTPEKYLNHLHNKTLTEILNYERVKSGDTFLIKEGKVHSIGSGVMLAEIQQTSDVTYRIYDWDRRDDLGEQRELHTELALEAINFSLKNDFKVEYKKEENKPNKMVCSPYFTTNYLKINQSIKINNTYDSFIIYLCVEGGANISTSNSKEHIKKGETILIPANILEFEITSKNATLLEVYV